MIDGVRYSDTVTSAGYELCSHGCSRKARTTHPSGGDHRCCGDYKHNITHAYWDRDGRKEGDRR